MARTTESVATRNTPGLEARRSSSGVVTYRVRYRLPDGRQRAMTLKGLKGRDALTTARERARDILAAVGRGEDPAAKQTGGLTVVSAAARWVRANRRRWRPRTTREFLGLLRRNVVGRRKEYVFGDREVNSLTRAEVWKSLRDLAAKHAVTANRAFATWRALVSWLQEIDQEWLGITANPLAGLKRPGGSEAPRSRVFTDDEVRRVLRASAGTDEGDLVEFLFHTAARDGEARLVRWSDVDLEREVWTIPAERSKNRQQRQVPLSTGAVAVLKRRDRTRFASGRVFPQARQTRTLRAIAIEAGLLRSTGSEEKPEWEGECLRLHDVRRTVGDRMKAEHGEAVMHAVLGHADARLTATYGPTPRLRAVAAALQWWSDEVARITKRAA